MNTTLQLFPGERLTMGHDRDAAENTWKLEAVFRWGIFRIFPAGSGNFPESFLRDPVAGAINLDYCVPSLNQY